MVERELLCLVRPCPICALNGLYLYDSLRSFLDPQAYFP
jgi:hypothetical protein